jgi:hypothetical protein
LGYHGANASVAENYLTHGTGYFAAQGLACLLIAPADPFWTEVEQPIPADGAGGRVALLGPQMVVRVRPRDGEARLFPVAQPFMHHGRWQRGAKYCQHAYSSDLGFCLDGEGGQELGAGRTGFSLDGQRWVFRARPYATRMDQDHIAGVYEMDFEAASGSQSKLGSQEFGEITTHTLIGEAGEVHVFWHNSTRPVYLHLGGYGITVADAQLLTTGETPNQIIVGGPEGRSVLRILRGPQGDLQRELLEPREGWLHTHLFGGKGVFPYWQSAAPVAPHIPVVAYVDGAKDGLEVPPCQVTYMQGRLSIQLEGRIHQIQVPW